MLLLVVYCFVLIILRTAVYVPYGTLHKMVMMIPLVVYHLSVVTTALNIMSTVFVMSSLEADTGYDIEVVDHVDLQTQAFKWTVQYMY